MLFSWECILIRFPTVLAHSSFLPICLVFLFTISRMCIGLLPLYYCSLSTSYLWVPLDFLHYPTLPLFFLSQVLYMSCFVLDHYPIVIVFKEIFHHVIVDHLFIVDLFVHLLLLLIMSFLLEIIG